MVELPLVCPTCSVRYPVDFRVCPKDGSELSEAEEDAYQDELIGKKLRQTYVLVKVLGEGGMGRVYEARHTRIPTKRFAIKMLHPEFLRKSEVLSRFQREAEAAASIRSVNVVQVVDVDKTEDGRPYLVSELLEGTELADHLEKNGKMAIPPAVRVARQLCQGLAAAHAIGIIHRDMKPENVFLVGDIHHPTAKVIDFGISKTGDAPGTKLTKTGMIMGTPSYMAPEQARGETVTAQVDVYAVGAILYCMLTGKRPFDHDDPTATLAAVLTTDPARPRTIEPSIPEGLEAVVQKAMAKDPQERYATISDFEAALGAFAPNDVGLRVATPGGTQRPMLASRAESGISAEVARPAIAMFGGLAGFFGLAAALTLVSSIVRMARGSGADANLSGTEALVILLVLFAALAAPTFLLVRGIHQRYWQNSAAAISLAQRLMPPVLIGAAAYGFAAIFIRMLESVVLRRAIGVAWPVWDFLLVLIAGGAVALFLTRRGKR